MRRLDAIGISLGVFVAGGVAYVILKNVGLDAASAGIWSQVLLVAALVGWVATYLFRFATSNMTYHQQLRDYAQAVIEKRWESMTPEERDRLVASLEEDESSDASPESSPDSSPTPPESSSSSS